MINLTLLKEKIANIFTIAFSDTLLRELIDSILQCGLILDEDMDVFLYHWNQNTSPPHFGNANHIKPKALKIMIFSSSVIGAAMIAQKYKFKISLACLLPAVYTSFTFLMNNIDTQKKRKNVYDLVKNLQSISKMNNSIIQYLKLRCSSRSLTEEEIFDPLTKSIKHLITTLCVEEVAIFGLLKNNICRIAQVVPNVIDDFLYVENITYDFIGECDNMEDCISATEKLSDMYLLLRSSFLCSLCLMLLSVLKKSDQPELHKEINNIISNTNRKLVEINKNIMKVFNEARYNSHIQNWTQNKIKKNRSVSSKLQNSLITSITNLYVVLEKAQNLLQKMEQLDSDESFENLGESIIDLRNQTFESFESLDIICRLHEVLVKKREQTHSTTNDHKAVEPKNTCAEPGPEVQTIKFDDLDQDLEDEEYELYIGENDDLISNVKTGIYDDSSEACLGILVEELKKSLKEHQRFIAARKKRGIVDEEVSKEIKYSTEHNEKKESEDWKTQTPLLQIQALPPPLSQQLDQSVLEVHSSKLPGAFPNTAPPPPPMLTSKPPPAPPMPASKPSPPAPLAKQSTEKEMMDEGITDFLRKLKLVTAQRAEETYGDTTDEEENF